MTPTSENKKCCDKCGYTDGRWTGCSNPSCPCHLPLQVNEAKEICEHGFKQGECMNPRCPFYFGHTVKKPAPDAWADIKEEFNKTKFAKGGGSSFECSDYEGMDTELRAFLKKHIEAAEQRGKEAEAIAHTKGDMDAYKAGAEMMKAKARELVKKLRYEPYRDTKGETSYARKSSPPGKGVKSPLGAISYNKALEDLSNQLTALSLTEIPE